MAANRTVWVVTWNHSMGFSGIGGLFTTQDAAQAYARQKEIERGPIDVEPGSFETYTTWEVYEDEIFRTASAALKRDEEENAE